MQRWREIGARALVPVTMLVAGAVGTLILWINHRQSAVSPVAKLQQDVAAEVHKVVGKISYGVSPPAKFLEPTQPPAIDGVDLADKGADGALLKQLCQLTSIQRLNLDGTNIQPGEFSGLSQLVGLQSLSLARTKIVDSDLVALAKLPQLKTLSLRETSIGDEGVKQIAGLPALQNLNLSQTNITSASMAAIASIPVLRTISLDEECITQESVSHLKARKKLTMVEVRVTTGFGKQARDLLAGQLSATVSGVGKTGQQIWDGTMLWDETLAGGVEAVTAKFDLDSQQSERLLKVLVGRTFERPRPPINKPMWAAPPAPPPQVINTFDEFLQAVRSSNQRQQDLQNYVRDRFSKADIPKLLQVLQSPENDDPSSNLHWHIPFLLVHFGLEDPAVIQELERLLSHKDPMIRSRTCGAFSNDDAKLPYDTDWISSDKIAEFAIPHLARLCNDEVAMVRNAACEEIIRIVTEHPKLARQAMPALINSIRHGSYFYALDGISRIADLDKEAAVAAAAELQRMLENVKSEVPTEYLETPKMSRDSAIASHCRVVMDALCRVALVDPALAKEAAAQCARAVRENGINGPVAIPFSAQNQEDLRNSINEFLDLAESDNRRTASNAIGALVGLIEGRRNAPPEFSVQLDVIKQELNPSFCWFHPRIAAVPEMGKQGKPLVVLTLQKHLEADDHYSGLHYMTSGDLGATWSEIKGPQELDWKPGEDNETIAVCDVTPGWHPQTKKVIAIGTMLRYSQAGAQLMDKPRSYDFAYAVYDPQADSWTAWQKLDMPMGNEKQFHQVAPGCVQWLVKSDGTLLVPVYFQGPKGGPYAVTVVQASFDGSSLKYVSNGNELYLDDVRGLVEPSLAFFQYDYYLTLRNDNRSYVTKSYDGIHFLPIKPWKFDDGSELGSYNTQQHWVVHRDGLFLAYTRRGANNDHITRHRAPLFMARVSSRDLQVLRATEKELIPERGVMLGNFGAAAVDENEWWVTDSEFITGGKAHARGADGSTFAARIKWSKPSF